MPLSSRDKGITKLGGENFPEQILRLPMVFLVTGTQIINIHVFNTPLTLILSFFLLNWVHYQSYKNAPARAAKNVEILMHHLDRSPVLSKKKKTIESEGWHE